MQSRVRAACGWLTIPPGLGRIAAHPFADQHQLGRAPSLGGQLQTAVFGLTHGGLWFGNDQTY